jgi:Fe-S-cluster-containing hydrogenase component 2
VRCHGDCHITPHKYVFDGVQSCAACNRFYSGSKTCTSGCLGYGDCAHVCPHGAISIIDRIAKVDKSKCIGCGLCVDACPNGLIVVRKISQSVDVTCSSKDSARVTKSLCEGGCVGCKLCEKNCEKGAIHIVDNHAVIDYDKCDNCGKCADVCKIGSVMRLG